MQVNDHDLIPMGENGILMLKLKILSAGRIIHKISLESPFLLKMNMN
jgi:hypothetical protein